ncbi:MAG: hypothetical protein A3C85_02475 [Candidatus Doudnabacteria bacterium RIFCSPHIGHO2_02_FULL_48_21]|uniref:Uncharacterized protein n=1 Tax=Candidatus Doudnabacteria bacterium RIFCSPLOWO2_02_FULL_48_13 TaxID=1817845 RepID=A0A1F5Q8T2_9BACT|nr:MAG: hypothetical protein A3K05_01615 [Candidatus Doudnabacteria bacterium RIFCSPHIGHO2_01_48_18]OGE78471.1 MAG: hypothetical protein A2668_04085 [Candidatus Doudnabacteria bacterium RIFCSPHIGHO2_01_FULL_48_180]OGE90991.1 MAG: hypothetical protein A3F44_01080 [Candidatus Doudnabacteria bacterium RIFCSPHIGHO2_12_FULL_47_25]OGE93913.1 MAG: hypothetical protein A3C85_02475 [Candidatus Doudnabacteria bacterium RIFCSPHIGHO2_02_FULL_48_21]OGE97674.1 MAG: hypothetical protein A3A83_04390 [Candidatu
MLFIHPSNSFEKFDGFLHQIVLIKFGEFAHLNFLLKILAGKYSVVKLRSACFHNPPLCIKCSSTVIPQINLGRTLAP